VTCGALGGPNEELLARIGFGTGSPLWTALSSVLWAMDLTGYVATTALLLVFGTLAERELGALRTATIFLASQVSAPTGLLRGPLGRRRVPERPLSGLTGRCTTRWQWIFTGRSFAGQFWLCSCGS
jgi:hypothetical protein